ncbi:helix-turn-helix domain-containing protein [Moritella viscosa]|uniref:helix-turn-helix domain-containing protein n=1 Tax=Moritella viscosa TaxID=80854 RepID=UPI0009183775|nr:helix-turn-helix domain-containing protein [Moritella viscosa]SGY90296.1 Putative uncharacterized protein [Moritella viscosa]
MLGNNSQNKMFNPDVLTKGKKAGRPKVLTDEQIQEAQKLRDQGYTLDSIGNAFGVSHMTIARVTHK